MASWYLTLCCRPVRKLMTNGRMDARQDGRTATHGEELDNCYVMVYVVEGFF